MTPLPYGHLNILTFDIEDWYHINYPQLDYRVYDEKEDHSSLLSAVKKILSFLKERNTKATFFILGRIAEKKPEMVLSIAEDGHEIALHGYEHYLLKDIGKEQFKRETERCIKIFEGITGKIPKGFRAPSWSATPWLFGVLKEMGFEYDASVFPVKTPLYGIPDAPRQPFFAGDNLLEIPTSVYRLSGKNIAFSGGVFFKIFPWVAIKNAINKIKQEGLPLIFFFHPWDLWNRPGKLPGLKTRFMFDLKIGNVENRFLRLLESLPMNSIASALKDLKNGAIVTSKIDCKYIRVNENNII
ncbi:MAG: polysaccharide deacetylase family protein [Nitrospinae bacterium]|nr:polysaccharide deacetylase family protein [Nitrospinota bacterium]